ncbi:MAG: cobyric acid synthase [Dermatophilaceae bacterium]
MTAPGFLVAGTSSDAGKSLVVTGLCRHLARQGLSVAPYKAQNMSNNSMVCRDGGEIGRAQYLQAQAAGVEATWAMNPVLLKPGTDRRAHVVSRGHPAGTLEAGEYATGRAHLARAAFEAYEELAGRYDVVVAEGAGSPAEINLRSGDYVNMGLARRFGLPVVLVGDIDRGGLLASLVGHHAILDAPDRALLAGFVVNKFRGDVDVLIPGLEEVTARTGMRCRGVLPWLPDVWLDGEDALAFGGWSGDAQGQGVHAGELSSEGRLRVAVVRLPRTSNATDVDPLAAEPGVDVLVTTDPSVCATADLLIVPGTRSTFGDLAWLRARGLGDVVAGRVALGRPVLGICGGFQMLAGPIEDGVESPEPSYDGLGLLPLRVRFGEHKILARPQGVWRGAPATGYAIHHGRPEPTSSTGLGPVDDFPGGLSVGGTYGTMWHGLLEGDAFRRAWLTEVATRAGSSYRPRAGALGYADRREAMIERLADAVGHLDLTGLV